MLIARSCRELVISRLGSTTTRRAATSTASSTHAAASDRLVSRSSHGPRSYRGYWDLVLEQPHSEQFDPTKLQRRPFVSPAHHPVVTSATSSSSTAQDEPPSQPPLSATPTLTDENDVPHDTVEAAAGEELARLNAEENSLVPPEVPTTCCMSGCVNCTWDLYQDNMEAFQASKNKIRARRRELLLAAGREKEAADVDEPFSPEESLDPSMAAFLELEKKLRG
ncbi:hypothetical protein HDU87_002229 [Geranomyces variabilis]|uniref:Oxidoreductase-like domain-containing protein n=1 Tax=Geranomyces variabilis TaxID=109894 RepID=A0AAD5TL80_9FUNG|nr:hypothetical protein HDU87_002229 [Geranomyces variabilis]